MGADVQKQIVRGAEGLGVSLSPDCASRLEAYFLILQKWSKTMRLVGSGDSESLLRHILDSLAPTRLDLPELPFVDIGSGAGFPGLPLAALHPLRPVFLVESRLRRAAFLKEAARAMELPEVQVLASRFEVTELPSDVLAMSRAVAPPPRFLAMVEERGVRQAVVMANETMLMEQYAPGWKVLNQDRPPLDFTPAHINLLCSMESF